MINKYFQKQFDDELNFEKVYLTKDELRFLSENNMLGSHL